MVFIIIMIITLIIINHISPWLNPYVTIITTIHPNFGCHYPPFRHKLIDSVASGTSCAAASKLLKASKCWKALAVACVGVCTYVMCIYIYICIYIYMYTYYIYIYIYIYIYLMYVYIILYNTCVCVYTLTNMYVYLSNVYIHSVCNSVYYPISLSFSCLNTSLHLGKSRSAQPSTGPGLRLPWDRQQALGITLSPG